MYQIKILHYSLTRPDCSSFQDKIAKCRYWPVEVMRLPQPASGKGKKVRPRTVASPGPSADNTKLLEAYQTFCLKAVCFVTKLQNFVGPYQNLEGK